MERTPTKGHDDGRDGGFIVTLDIKELERVWEARDGGDQCDLWAFSVAVDEAFPRILARLKAAEEWYEASRAMAEAMVRSDTRTLLPIRERMDAAEAALIAAHEGEGNE